MEENKTLSTEKWKRQKQYKKAMFTEMQNYSYSVKVRQAEERTIEFYIEMQNRGFSTHVSIGGV